MNALKASSSSKIIKTTAKRVPPSFPVDQILDDKHSDYLSIEDDDACSLDDLSIIEDIDGQEGLSVRLPDDEQVSMATGVLESDSFVKNQTHASNNDEEDSSIKVIQDFLEPFLREEDKQQPVAVLQKHYSEYQYGQDKHSQQKSVKWWFQYTQRYGDRKSLWWTSEVHVPSDVAKQWGFDVSDDSPLEIRSGPLPFTSSGLESVESSNSNGEHDVLLDLFGVYKKHVDGSGEEKIWFKTKGGAQKSSTLNLLFLLESRKEMNAQVVTNGVQVLNNKECNTPGNVSPRQFPLWVNRLYALGFGRKSTRRFTLHTIKHSAALVSPNGSIMSSKNPCIISCTLIYSYNNFNSNRETVTVTSTGNYFKKEHSFEDVLSQLEFSLPAPCVSLSRSSAAEAQEKAYIMDRYDGNISYEVALPRWSTCEIGRRAFLYEVKFSTTSRHTDNTYHPKDSVPLDDLYGLKSSTRMGLLTGCDIFEGLHDKTQELTAEFTVPKSVMADGPLSVVICNKTIVDMSQIEAEIAMMAPGETVGPLSLIKCFNAILFENGGKTYGMCPSKSPKEILSLLLDEFATECDRKYCFLPLLSSTISHNNEKLCIDWRIILDVLHNVTHPAIQRFEVNPLYYYVVVFILTAILIIECAVYREKFKIMPGSSIDILASICGPNGMYNLKVIVGLILVTLFSIDKFVPPRRVPAMMLSNRFIKQPVGFRGNLFVLDRRESNSNLTSSSPLFRADVIATIPNGLKESFYNRHKEQLALATYASYYARLTKSKQLHSSNQTMRNGLRLKYQNEHLIKTLHVRCHADHDFTLSGHLKGVNKKTATAPPNSIAKILAMQGYLIPELVQLLSMPRDLLYVSQHASHFMTALERNHSLKVAVSRLSQLRTKAFDLVDCDKQNMSLVTLEGGVNKATELGNKNTTASTTREDERLESLGDAVLMFLVVVKLFASCPNRKEHVLDWFKAEIERHGKNVVLHRGALLLGLHRLCSNKQKCVSSWNSAYTTSSVHGSDSETMMMKRLSNVLESLLGAAYLSDPTGAVAVGILSEMSPCFELAKHEVATGDNPCWFTSKSTCLVAGYQFEKDSIWTSEMNQLNQILQEEPSVLSTLVLGATKLTSILLKHSAQCDIIAKIKSQRVCSLLIYTAIFDDSLDEMEMRRGTASNNLECLAIARDKLFHIGHATLLLCLIKEIYYQNPTATSGDIHFSKAFVLSDDSLAYIFIKNGLHECMFDKQDESVQAFMDHMHVAETMGQKFWAQNNGWILPDGVHEFNRRVKLMSDNDCNLDTPRYVGLAAGRLYGQSKCISKDVTDDLMFSMKTIVGALCLSVGAKDTWTLVRPLFLELLVLSPDETRHAFAHVSDLASKCKKGNR